MAVHLRGKNIARVAVEFTRPSDAIAYAIGDVVSNSTTATVPMAFANLMRGDGLSGYLVVPRLTTNVKSLVPRFRVHMFNAIPTVLSGDNLPHQEKYVDVGTRLGYFDLPAMITAADSTNSDQSRSVDMAVRVPVSAIAGSTTLYALLETLDVFTPVSGQKFMLTLSADRY